MLLASTYAALVDALLICAFNCGYIDKSLPVAFLIKITIPGFTFGKITPAPLIPVFTMLIVFPNNVAVFWVVPAAEIFVCIEFIK